MCPYLYTAVVLKHTNTEQQLVLVHTGVSEEDRAKLSPEAVPLRRSGACVSAVGVRLRAAPGALWLKLSGPLLSRAPCALPGALAAPPPGTRGRHSTL